MKSLIKKYKHIWILSYAFLYLPWFMWLEKHVTTGYHLMHTALDDVIPFNEYFIVPYLLWFIYVVATIMYFFFTDKHDYYRLCTFLFTGMTASLLICTLFPNGTDLRPVFDPGKNMFTRMVSALYATDTCTNVFPSIHVFNSIGTYIAICNSKKLSSHHWIKTASFLLSASICMATVFLKQHSIIDVAGAFLMAYPIYGMVYGFNGLTERKKVAQKAIS